MRQYITVFFQRHALKVLLIWIVILSILYSLLSIIRHNTFQSGAFDLGIFDQAVWQYAHFLYPYNTIKERFILGDHFTLTLPLLAPLYWIWDNVQILLIFQAVWISCSTLAVYLIAKTRTLSSGTAFLVSLVYSFFYGFQFGVFFDFHPVIIGVGLLAWVVYFLEANKRKLFIVTVILLLLTQENMGIALAGIGCFYIFQKERRFVGLWFIIGGFIVSIIESKIIALFSPIGFQYTPHISHNIITIIQNYFDAPEKRQVWFYSLSWFSFLPIFSPGAILAVFMDLGQYFVTGPDFQRMWSPYLHHRAILAVFLVLGTIDVLVFLKRRHVKTEYIASLLLILAMFWQYHFHFALDKLTKKVYWQHESWMDNDNALFRFLPPEASVASSQNLVPHISHRKEVYLIYPRRHTVSGTRCAKTECWWLDFAGKPTFMLIDLHPNQWITQLLESNENFGQAVRNMEEAKKIVLVKQIGDSRLYRTMY